MWNEINNNEDLKRFMEIHYYFHDSCIKELKYVSGAYVNADLSMQPVNEKRILKLIIQRQFEENSVIEMEFTGLKCLKMFPNDEDYTCEIFGASMFSKDDCIFWCDCDDISESDLETYEGTVICASKVQWRVANEYIGSKEIY